MTIKQTQKRLEELYNKIPAGLLDTVWKIVELEIELEQYNEM